MKLELKHLSLYLPYKLQGFAQKENYTGDIETIISLCNEEITTDVDCITYDSFKPILRPLSDLTKELYWELSKKDPNKSFGFWYGKYEGNNDKRDFIHYEGYSSRNYFLIDGYEQFSYKMMLFFFENHFDVFGLIEKGLAIDINTLPQ